MTWNWDWNVCLSNKFHFLSTCLKEFIFFIILAVHRSNSLQIDNDQQIQMKKKYISEKLAKSSAHSAEPEPEININLKWQNYFESEAKTRGNLKFLNFVYKHFSQFEQMKKKSNFLLVRSMEDGGVDELDCYRLSAAPVGPNVRLSSSVKFFSFDS